MSQTGSTDPPLDVFGLCLGYEIYLWLPTALRGRRTPVVNEANTKRGAAA
jgi:hypothetical protein